MDGWMEGVGGAAEGGGIVEGWLVIEGSKLKQTVKTGKLPSHNHVIKNLASLAWEA